MSLPPELRVLCAHLSTISTTDLPRMTPTLLRLISHCREPLSNPPSNTAKADSNTASIQVHKLKTQISSLLTGKSVEGRFTAVVLIKGIVEVGGWEILKTSEPWVRGLLSILNVNIFLNPVNAKLNYPETRSCCDKGDMYCNSDQDILYDPSISNTPERNHHSNITWLHYLVSEFDLLQKLFSSLIDD